MRRICVVTGTRAEYGLLKWLMQEIKDDAGLELQIVATGMHLSPEFGMTYQEIEGDGFFIDRKVEMLISSDTSIGAAKSMGLGLIGFADALNDLKPDVVVVLGDRFEIFSAAAAALVAQIPLAHIHGGEATEGLVDEAIRHSITKMSQLHFVATDIYRKRVIQLGEQPEHIFLVGGLGVDAIQKIKLLNRTALETAIDFSLGRKSLLVTFHPITLEGSSSKEQMQELLLAISFLKDTQIIFTFPNADTQGRELAQMVKNFVLKHPNARAYESLGQLLYLSCLAHVDGIIGNSSSGLLEAPTFKKGVINIGDRQRGRVQAHNIINCKPDAQSIKDALGVMYSEAFQAKLKSVINPYGNGGAIKAIVSTLKQIPLDGIVKKRFFDIENKCV